MKTENNCFWFKEMLETMGESVQDYIQLDVPFLIKPNL